MSLSAYLRDNLAAIGVGVLCCLGVAGMLAVLGVGVDATVLVPCFVALCGAVVLGLGYVRRRRFYAELARIVEDLDRTYFASELVEEPGFLEGRLAHEALEAVGKAAADDVAFHRRQAESYRDYIELWIHEIKTPIAAAHLMTADLHGGVASKLKAELDRIESYVEQALYYARSTSLARDYAIRELSLADAVRDGLQEERPLPHRARHHPVHRVGDGVTVFADASWLSFAWGRCW